MGGRKKGKPVAPKREKGKLGAAKVEKAKARQPLTIGQPDLVSLVFWFFLLNYWLELVYRSLGIITNIIFG